MFQTRVQLGTAVWVDPAVVASDAVQGRESGQLMVTLQAT